MRKSVLVAWLFCIGVPVVAEQSIQPESTWEEVGRWIETPHHEKLLRLRRDPATSIAPFTTDGCSGGMSATWAPVAQIIPGFAENYSESPPWEACCVVHDQAYYNASDTQTAFESYNARLNADKTLMQCVLQDGVQRRDTLAEEFSIDTSVVDQAYTLIAKGMYQAVRLGGGPCSGLSWRWGYGYPSCLWSN